MPLLGPADPLPARPARVLVAGTSGSGKSTLARQVSTTLKLPYTELDSLFHGPGWTELPTFADDVRSLAEGERWVTEYQYAWIRPILRDRADLLVALELPRPLVMSRVVRRTVRRSRRQTVLWNGNVEPPLRTFFTDREHIVRWAWRTHGDGPDRIADALTVRPDLPVVVLRSRRDVDRWLAGPLAAAAV